MKKITFAAMAAALMVPAVASADVTVKLPADAEAKYPVTHSLFTDMVKPRAERPQQVVDTVAVVNGTMKLAVDPAGAARYYIMFGGRDAVSFYAMPGDDLVVDVTSVSPLDYTVAGSELMNGVSELKKQENAVVARYQEIVSKQPVDQEAVKQVQQDYTNVIKDFIKAHQGSPAALSAMMNLDGEDFMEYYAQIPETAKHNPMFTLVDYQKGYVEKSIAAEKKLAALQSGNVDAPKFTLKNLEGKNVSLSDFKGKWVILDFWGGWCPWCIKGFPALKDAYEQYKPELEIIGVDCNESEDAWKKAVAKYELPWVQVYNPGADKGCNILAEYGVQGFPTKVIVNPEGKVANITVGEDPSFFETLGKLINGK